MLKIVEYGLLAVTLLVVVGLIVSGSRSSSESSSTEPAALTNDNGEAQGPGKTQ
jgi:hypothetical protein